MFKKFGGKMQHRISSIIIIFYGIQMWVLLEKSSNYQNGGIIKVEEI